MAEELPITQAPLNKARKDKFRLVLSIPNVMKGIEARTVRENDYLNLDSLQFSVYGVNIPSIKIPHVPLHYSGQDYNVTSFDRPAYEPINVSFSVDNEFKNYWVIWKWLQLMNDPIDSTYGRPSVFSALDNEYPELEPETLYDYTTNINLIALDEYNKEKINYEFRHAFPTELGGYDYNFRDPDEIACRFQFVFNQLDVSLV